MLEIDKQSPGWDRIIPDTGEPEIVLSDFPNFIDGPVWDAGQGCLFLTEGWMNVRPGKIWKWRPGSPPELVLDRCKALGATLDNTGRLVVCGWVGRNVWRLEHDGSVTVLASHYRGMRLNTPNDLALHSSGAVYWTDQSRGLLGSGRAAGGNDDLQRYLDFHSVMRVWPGSSHLEPVADDFEAPNGIAFSPDERLLYVNDTARWQIRVFDVHADGTLANSRVFYEAEPDLPGVFDGMKVDVEGNVYCTGPGGIHVIRPDGSLLVRIRFPEPVFNIAWGGPEWTSMFCTRLGSLYRIELKVPGVPVGKR